MFFLVLFDCSQSFFVCCIIFFSFVAGCEPIDLLNVAFEQQLNSTMRYEMLAMPL